MGALYIEKENKQLAVCKKREDDTLCISIAYDEFGEDYEVEILINKSEAQQIVDHLISEFQLKNEAFEALKNIVDNSPNFEFHKNEKLEEALRAGEKLLKLNTK